MCVCPSCSRPGLLLLARPGWGWAGCCGLWFLLFSSDGGGCCCCCCDCLLLLFLWVEWTPVGCGAPPWEGSGREGEGKREGGECVEPSYRAREREDQDGRGPRSGARGRPGHRARRPSSSPRSGREGGGGGEGGRGRGGVRVEHEGSLPSPSCVGFPRHHKDGGSALVAPSPRRARPGPTAGPWEDARGGVVGVRWRGKGARVLGSVRARMEKARRRGTQNASAARQSTFFSLHPHDAKKSRGSPHRGAADGPPRRPKNKGTAAGCPRRGKGPCKSLAHTKLACGGGRDHLFSFLLNCIVT